MSERERDEREGMEMRQKKKMEDDFEKGFLGSRNETNSKLQLFLLFLPFLLFLLGKFFFSLKENPVKNALQTNGRREKKLKRERKQRKRRRERKEEKEEWMDENVDGFAPFT